MSLQNRVTPFGEIIATPEKGLLMGNRGILHDHETKTLGVSRWKHRAWISCVTSFKGRKRTVMGKGTYTELFFLDEVTTLAAGHRPCFECRRAAAEDFLGRDALARRLAQRATAKAFDALAQTSRVRKWTRHKITFDARLGDLPDGTMVAIGEDAVALRQGRVLRWTPGGYLSPVPADGNRVVRVLTPRPFVGILAQGYQPVWHETASGT